MDDTVRKLEEALARSSAFYVVLPGGAMVYRGEIEKIVKVLKGAKTVVSRYNEYAEGMEHHVTEHGSYAEGYFEGIGQAADLVNNGEPNETR